MKFFLRLLFLTHSLSSFSQVTFCHVGSEWNFLFTQAWHIPWASVNETIKYNGYVIENSDTVKLLNHTRFFSEINTGAISFTSIKQKGDTIFMRNNFTNNQWQILYNFASMAGQSWTNTFTNGDSYTTTVINSGTTNINNLSVKRLTVNYSALSASKSFTYTDVITERYGSSRFLFNYISRSQSDGDMVLESLCFKDNQIGLKQFSTKPCNYSNMVNLEELNRMSNYINVFPNPAGNVLNVGIEDDVEVEIIIRDASNRCVLKQPLPPDRKLDISGLETGMYFVSAFIHGIQKGFQKILKE